jgi:hypothetical protein
MSISRTPSLNRPASLKKPAVQPERNARNLRVAPAHLAEPGLEELDSKDDENFANCARRRVEKARQPPRSPSAKRDTPSGDHTRNPRIRTVPLTARLRHERLRSPRLSGAPGAGVAPSRIGRSATAMRPRAQLAHEPGPLTPSHPTGYGSAQRHRPRPPQRSGDARL